MQWISEKIKKKWMKDLNRFLPLFALFGTDTPPPPPPPQLTTYVQKDVRRHAPNRSCRWWYTWNLNSQKMRTKIRMKLWASNQSIKTAEPWQAGHLVGASNSILNLHYDDLDCHVLIVVCRFQVHSKLEFGRELASQCQIPHSCYRLWSPNHRSYYIPHRCQTIWCTYRELSLCHCKWHSVRIPPPWAPLPP